MNTRTETIIEPSEKILGVQQEKLREIKIILPNSEVEPVGAMAVPMVGRPELDFMVISNYVEEDSKELVGNGYKQGPKVNATSFLKIMNGDIEVAVQIMPPESKMIETHRKILDKLRKDDSLRKKYEEFKRSLSGLGREEYKQKKSEWIRGNIKPLL